MEYNTTRSPLSMREYGRHIQKMVDYLLTIQDKEKRQQQAEELIELMGFLNPHLKNVEDFRHKLWDHLFFMSDFKLDVDSDYPKPTRETYKVKPDPLPYPDQHPKFAHLGKNLGTLIDKAMAETDPEKKKGLTNAIAYYMKLAYSSWHKEQVSDEAIMNELNSITHGVLDIAELPHFKYHPTIEKEEFRSGNNKKNFSARGGNRNTGNRNANRNNRGNGNGNRSNNNYSGNFKKRFK